MFCFASCNYQQWCQQRQKDHNIWYLISCVCLQGSQLPKQSLPFGCRGMGRTPQPLVWFQNAEWQKRVRQTNRQKSGIRDDRQTGKIMTMAALSCWWQMESDMESPLGKTPTIAKIIGIRVWSPIWKKRFSGKRSTINGRIIRWNDGWVYWPAGLNMSSSINWVDIHRSYVGWLNVSCCLKSNLLIVNKATLNRSHNL